MDNSGRREAPITFFFLQNFVSYNIYTPQGNPILRLENKKKGFLVIHRLWMSLLVLSSGVFFYFHPPYFSRKPPFHSRNHFCKSMVCSQFVFQHPQIEQYMTQIMYYLKSLSQKPLFLCRMESTSRQCFCPFWS